MSKKRTLTSADFTTIGKRHSCDLVAQEASAAASRWERDVSALAGYGFGVKARARFEALRAEHLALREARPEAVAAKRGAYRTRDATVAAGWAWVDQASSILGGAARADVGVADALAAAEPSEDAGLEAGIPALAKLLTAHKALVDDDVDVDGLVARAGDLAAKLGASPGAVAGAVAAPVADTAAIDLLDGKLYIFIRDLNEAGRKAIRNGALAARRDEYGFHHLNQSGRPAAPAPTPASPATPTT